MMFLLWIYLILFDLHVLRLDLLFGGLKLVLLLKSYGFLQSSYSLCLEWFKMLMAS